jgi:hypothetical protein
MGWPSRSHDHSPRLPLVGRICWTCAPLVVRHQLLVRREVDNLVVGRVDEQSQPCGDARPCLCRHPDHQADCRPAEYEGRNRSGQVAPRRRPRELARDAKSVNPGAPLESLVSPTGLSLNSTFSHSAFASSRSVSLRSPAGTSPYWPGSSFCTVPSPLTQIGFLLCPEPLPLPSSVSLSSAVLTVMFPHSPSFEVCSPRSKWI